MHLLLYDIVLLDPLYTAIFLPIVPVQFNPTVYTVTERDDNVATVMLEALRNHDFDFMVNVSTIDGTAKSEKNQNLVSLTHYGNIYKYALRLSARGI